MSGTNVLLNLVREYFTLQDGMLIPNHTELLFVCDIEQTNTEHQHLGTSVSISRRALKHMVESRKRELIKNRSSAEVLELIEFAVASIPHVILNFDYYEFEVPSKHFYTKDFSAQGKPNIRILLEVRESQLLIISVHFSRRTKKHH